MHIAKGWLLAGFLLIGGLVCLWLAGCDDDNPTKPKPAEPKDYPVYFADSYDSLLFTYYPISRKIDTAHIPWLAEQGITASADGKRLYLATNNNVVVINAFSHELITELPYKPERPVAVSRDNKLVAITGKDLHILCTSNYSEIFSDTDYTYNGCFSNDSKTFYCGAGWSTDTVGVVYKVNLSDNLHPVERRPMADGGVLQVVPSHDETRLYLYLGLNMWTSAFEVYDIAADSVVYSEILVPGAGQITLTPDGQYAVYTDPAATATDPQPPGTFTIYDCTADTVYRVVPTADYADSLCALCTPCTLTVTPDGRWLVLIAGSQMSQHALFQYDMENEELVNYIGFEFFQLTNPTVRCNK
jgi:DNA-binding beta-propeller fold protein YncE